MQTPVAPSLDAYAPQEIAARVATVGVAKARRDALTTLVLAVLAGAFISLGALLFTVTMTDAQLGFGLDRLVGGVAFSLGLILVVIAGAELFTGNNLIAMAWAARLITLRDLGRNWGLVYLGNAAGALATVGLAYLGGVHLMAGGAVGKTLAAIGAHKAGLSLVQMLALGILCNALVCLAVWLTMAGRSVSDKIPAIVFPIAAFVAMGFEHSIANMFFLPYAILLDGLTTPALLNGSLVNLLVVTLGNVIGGSILVAGIYWLAFLRRPPTDAQGSDQGETHEPRRVGT